MKPLRSTRNARLVTGAFGLVLSAFLLAGAPAALGQGGCIVSTPTTFEPNPPGPAAPRNVGLLSPVAFNHLSLYQGSSGAARILMQETFGYSTLDLTNPAQPSVLRYDYFPFDTNKVPINGDGQSYTQAITASSDGQRVALSLNGPIPAWANTVVGYPDGNNGWTLWGDTAPVGGVGNAILKSGSRYVHYGMTSFQFYASDVTNQPATFAGSNIPAELTGLPGGARLSTAGSYLVYTTATGDIQIIDASNPGPAGSIASGLKWTTIPSSSPMFNGHSIGATKSALEPGNAKMLWILAELQPASGENSPSYALFSVTQDLAGNFGTPVPAGAPFRVPSVVGDNWTSAGNSSYLAEHNGTLYVLMWAFRRTPSIQYVLHSTTTSAWTTGSFGVPQTITDPTFSLGEMKTLASGANLYGYMASGTSAWVVPMTCTAPNAKATAILTAVNPVTGVTVNSGDAVVYGETLTFAAQVQPTPTQGQNSDLAGFRWNFDFDFHTGSLVEDNGVGTSPRVKNNDNGEFGNSAYPPSGTFNLVGPCDPKNGGVRGTGTGCWASVTTNTAQGGPDFTGSEAAGAVKPLVVAFEANNANGSNGANLFTINWKRPTIGLVSSAIIAGDSLVASYDGHPQSQDPTFPWKWYLDGALVNCNTGSACIPAGANATAGQHTYWVTVPYAQIGYSTPDYTGTPMGTYTVSTFVPIFSVNGSATGPVGTTPSGTLTVANASKRANTNITGAYSYCIVPAGQSCSSYTSWSMADPTNTNGSPASSATIPNPGVGNWILKIRVAYTGGTVDWPDANPANGISLLITNSLSVSASVSPNPANHNDTVVFHCSATGGSGNYNYKWSGQFGDVAFTQDYTTRVTNTGGQDSSFSLDCSATDATSGASGFATAAVTVHPGAPAGAPTASASVSPNPVEVGRPATFSCTGTGGTGALTYKWTDSLFHEFSGQTYTYIPTSQAPVTLTCTVTDSANRTGTSSATLFVVPPPGPACPAVDWGVYVDGQELLPTPGQFGLEFPRTASVGTPLFFSIKSGISSQFEWNWGDGQVTTLTLAQYQANPPTHAYTTTGLKTITLRPQFVDDSGFCGGRSYDIQITGPNANFTPGYLDGSPFVVADVTAGKAVRFSASEGGATSYDWDFGDGLPHGSGQVVTHIFTTAGARTVTLTVVKGVTVSSSLTLTVHLPPEPPKWVVPGMAYLAGSGGAFWTSDVTIFNPDKVLAQKLSVAFLDPRNLVTDYSQLTFVPLADIPPLGALAGSNALQALGKPEGSYGALLFKGTLGQALAPVVVTRTFNDQSSQGKGTFGLSVPSASAATGGVTAQAAPAVQMLVGLRQDASARTNLAIVNLNNEWPTVKLDLYDGRTNSILGSKTLPLNPYQVLQVDRVLETVAGAGSTSDLFKVQVSVVDQSGGAHAYAVYPYATVIDAYSTDPIVVTPTSTPAAAYRIPGIVRLTGANGEKFRSRVTVSNPSLASRIVRMTYSFVSCDASGACGDRKTYSSTVGMAPGQTQAWDDWVKVWFQAKYEAILDEAKNYKDSLLDVTADDGNTDPLVVLGETYSDLGTAPDGTSRGHVGLQVPGYPAADGASRAGSGANGNTRLVLTGLRSDAAYRTNLALFVTSGTAGGWCRVRVYAPEGTLLKDVPVEVRPVMQVSGASLVAGIPGSLPRYSLVIDNFDEGIVVGGYATIIDNASADSTFVKALPVP
ncbi:MAG TPA: PKD domain-containing protein [Thermoanaerobaculia bacterium]|nr:PKD domain-containing protein [Thermoanaerobaculia bacterium]